MRLQGVGSATYLRSSLFVASTQRSHQFHDLLTIDDPILEGSDYQDRYSGLDPYDESIQLIYPFEIRRRPMNFGGVDRRLTSLLPTGSIIFLNLAHQI